MKPMYIALIIIGIALVAYGTQGLITKPSQSNNSTGAMGPEDSFPSIGYFESKDPAYNFDYPKFTNWESEVSSSTIAWTPASNNSTALGKITASMREISMKVNAGYWDSKPKNSHGIPYAEVSPPRSGDTGSNNHSIVFRLPQQGTSIELSMPEASAQTEQGKNLLEIIRNSFSEQ